MQKLLFAANDGVRGLEYHVTDGTTTTLLKDINPGAGSGAVPGAGVATLGGLVFFVADDGVHGAELHVSDGTEAGTFMLQDIFPGSRGAGIFDMQRMGEHVYFFAQDPVNGTELWRTDGTSAGTELVIDLRPGTSSATFREQSVDTKLVAFNGGLVFAADDGVSGRELWFTDGTAAGTRLIADINPAANADSRLNGSSPQFISDDGANILGNRLFFSADDGTNGREIWVTDGTTAGTRLVSDIARGTASSDPRDFQAYGSRMMFTADNGFGGRELWRSDGTQAGTQQVGEINMNGSAAPGGLTVLGNRLVFVANDGIRGEEPWVLTSPTGTPTLLRDVRDGRVSSISNGFTELGGKLYFAANDGERGFEVHVTDGTPGGTLLFRDIFEGPNTSAPRDFVKVGNALYFAATTAATGTELYRIDDGFAAVTLVADLFRGAGGSGVVPLAAIELNLAPTGLALAGDTVAEDAPAGFAIGTFTATDPNGDPLTFSLTDDAGGLFAVSGRALVVAAALDFETATSHEIEALVSDGQGGRLTARFTITVTDVDEAPGDIVLTGGTVAETAAAGAVVGTLSAADPEGDGFTFEITDDAGGLFALAANGVDVLLAGALDFEAAAVHEIEATVRDAGGATRSMRFAIAVTDIDEAPEGLTLDGAEIAENAPLGTVIGTLSAFDPEGETIVFTLADDAGGRVAIGADGTSIVVAGAIDFEQADRFEFEAVATDPGGNATAARFVVTVGDDPTETGFVMGTPGNDPALRGNPGIDDTIDGGAGFDTVIYDLTRGDLIERVQPGGSVAVELPGGERDLLVNIERIALLDGAYLYDLRPESQATYRLFGASLGRLPDEDGLRFWDGLNADGLGLEFLAEAFVRSPEFLALFGGANPESTVFVDALYLNVLRREADDVGRAFWIASFEEGMSRSEVLLMFSESAENRILNADNYDDGVFVALPPEA